jgi:septal ring factor EnvC (AmiA/AmiB activator)
LKHFIRIILVIAGLILTGTGMSAAGAAVDDAQAKAKEAQLEHLRRTIQALSDNLGTLRSQHKNQRTKLHTLNRKISLLNRSIQDLEAQRRRQDENLTQLQNRRRTGQEQLARQQRTLSQLLRAAYLLDQQSPLKILLNATEPATVERSLRYYDYFYRSRAEHIADINKTLVDLNNLERNIQSKQHELAKLVNHQHAQRNTLERSRRERNHLLAELNRDIRNTEQRLTQLKEDEQSLQELVKRLGRALATIPAPGKAVNFAQLKGKLSLPAQGTVAARFGTPRHVGQLKWQGIVIRAADGADVKAVAAGRVVFADWLRGFGLLIILDHGGGYMSLYGYNQELHKGVGDEVKAGEIIATVGNNGNHNQSGLYFEIRHQGTPVNPLHWCKSR